MMKKLSYKYCNNEEAIDICTNTLLKNAEKVEGLSKIEFNEIYIWLQKNHILFLTDTPTSKLMSRYGLIFRCDACESLSSTLWNILVTLKSLVLFTPSYIDAGKFSLVGII